MAIPFSLSHILAGLGFWGHVNLAQLTPVLAALGALVAIRIWIQIIMLDDAPDGKLLHTNEGKRELLWRLSDTATLERQSLPWWNKRVFIRLGYQGAFVYAIALTWLTMPFGQPLFVLTGFSLPTLMMSVLFLVTRLGFENWAKAQPEMVETLLASPEVQRLLEQNDD